MKKRHNWPLFASLTSTTEETPTKPWKATGVSKVSNKRWMIKGDQRVTKFLEDRAPKEEALLRDISNFRKGIYTA